MPDEISIKEIISFLENGNCNFSFKGEISDVIKGFSTLFNYKKGTITFVSSLNKFSDSSDLFNGKKIQLIITDPSEPVHDCFINTIQIEKPKHTFFSILDHFFVEESEECTISAKREIYEIKSYVSKNARIGKNVKIGIGCVVEGNVSIGDNTVIHHNVIIKSNTKIGKNCTILSGAIIGETGFNPLKKEDKSRNIIKHYGGVRIANNVHIGDNCSISRGSIDDTIISNGVKLNKQVIIAHNVFIGENTVFTAPTFVCGSVIIGDNCHIAATTIRNQCKVGNNATLGLGAVVVKDVLAGTTV